MKNNGQKNYFFTPECCELCNREVPLTFHHLIPKMVQGRNYFKKNFKKEDFERGTYLCRKCHSGIHKLYNEMTLAKEFNTLEALKADEAVMKHARWASKQKS